MSEQIMITRKSPADLFAAKARQSQMEPGQPVDKLFTFVNAGSSAKNARLMDAATCAETTGGEGGMSASQCWNPFEPLC